MELLKTINEWLTGCGLSARWADGLDQLIAFCLVLVLAFTADFICRKVLLRVVAHWVGRTKATWDDIVFHRKVMFRLSRMVAPVIIYLLVPVAFADTDSKVLGFLMRICYIYILISFFCFVNSFFKAVYQVYSQKEQFRDRPLKGLL